MNKSRYIQSAFALLVLLCLPASARAQSKRWEHNIYQGMGWVNKFVKEDEQNIALHVGYGINYHIDSRWSLMPGVGLRLKGFGHDNENAGNCSSTYIDFPILVQYHFGGEKRQGIVLECGPVLSFRAHGEKYHGGADWWLPHPFNGKQEYRKFDLGVRPRSLLRDQELALWRAEPCLSAGHQMQIPSAIRLGAWFRTIR